MSYAKIESGTNASASYRNVQNSARARLGLPLGAASRRGLNREDNLGYLPYFRWYPADAETDEGYSALNDQELGFFHRCLNKSWMSDGLPSDLDELCRLMRVSRKYLDKVWGRVGKRFIEDGGKLRNPRQEKERTYALTKSAGATAAVRSRYERRSDVGTNDLPHARMVSDLSKKETTLREFPTFEKDRQEAWVWFVAEFPGELHEEHDCQIFMSVIQTFEDIAALRKNMPLWKETDKWRRGFGNTAENFLRKGIFRDAPKAREPTDAYVYKPPEGGYYVEPKRRKGEENADESEPPI